MKCVIAPLPCPVIDGECDRDGECYIWRCENSNAPKPEPAAEEEPAYEDAGSYP